MRRQNKFLPVAGLSVLIALTVIGSMVLAQDTESTTDDAANMSSDAVCVPEADVRAACGETAPGEICYGAGEIALSGSDADFAESGDIVALDGVETISSSSGDSVVTFRVPVSDDSAIRGALYGTAEVTSLITEAPAMTQVMIEHYAQQPINLREGPSTNDAIAGVFPIGATAYATGRNNDGSWLRINSEEAGPVWIFASLVRVAADETGELDALPVVEGLYTQPMQAITLRTTGSSDSGTDCGKSGLLLEYNGDLSARMQINGVDIVLNGATVQVQATAGEVMRFAILDGDASLSLNNQRINVRGGVSVDVTLGGETGLEAVETPVVDPSFGFGDVAAAPMSLVSAEDAAMCFVGVSEAADGYLLPAENRGVAYTLNPDEHYRVTGTTTTDDSQDWLRVASASQAIGWVPQSVVQTAGMCGNVDFIDPTTAFTVAEEGSFVPAGRSIWNANSGEDVVSGNCNYPPLVMCNHLVAITPAGNAISWRGQEPQPYTLTEVADNEYSFAGRNQLGNANISLYLTFNSETNWTMTMTQIFDNDPECTHTFYYSATRRQ